MTRGGLALACMVLSLSSPAWAQNTDAASEVDKVCIIAGTASRTDIKACTGAVISCPSGQTSCPNYKGVQIG
ncbi:MAG TPA: hypothetical protein VHB73_07510, partial [Alphaproteobacteria bacterium]|nr:hypothetical protein [Alphaproteobacteria bacterium]